MVMFMMRMHQVGVAEPVQLIGVGRRERAVDLENGDAENEYERENVEKDAELDHEPVFKEQPRTENGYAVLENEKPEHLGDRLLARADEEQPRPHRRQCYGDCKF